MSSKASEHDRWLEHRIGKTLYGKGYDPNNRGTGPGRKIRKLIEMIDKNYTALKTSPDHHPQMRRLKEVVRAEEAQR